MKTKRVSRYQTTDISCGQARASQSVAQALPLLSQCHPLRLPQTLDSPGAALVPSCGVATLCQARAMPAPVFTTQSEATLTPTLSSGLKYELNFCRAELQLKLFLELDFFKIKY
jgi:hypothetical protein